MPFIVVINDHTSFSIASQWCVHADILTSRRQVDIPTITSSIGFVHDRRIRTPADVIRPEPGTYREFFQIIQILCRSQIDLIVVATIEVGRLANLPGCVVHVSDFRSIAGSRTINGISVQWPMANQSRRYTGGAIGDCSVEIGRRGPVSQIQKGSKTLFVASSGIIVPAEATAVACNV